MITREHKCEELEKANNDSEANCTFQIVKCNPEGEERNIWALVNNDDDYYSPPYINFCPFCGKDLTEIEVNTVVPIKEHHYIGP